MFLFQLGASETHGFCPTCTSILCTAYAMPCTFCCCKEKCLPCYLSSLLDVSMKKHSITEYPGPCQASKCCGAYYNMVCFASCMLCLMMREAKTISSVQPR